MNGNELRAAAERVAVVAAEYSAAAKQINPRTDAEGRLAGQVIALGFIASDMAAKCLDLLPPADDAEAVTTDWLRGLGFGTGDFFGPNWSRDDLWPISLRFDQNNVSCFYAGGVMVGSPNPTRGHVRRLLAALGITPGEPR